MPDYNVTIGMVYQVDGWTGNRSISGYTNSKNGYILIASPVGTVSPEDVTYMLDNDYDLYTFDQAEELEWRNYEASHFDLKPGKGYLYTNSGDVTSVLVKVSKAVSCPSSKSTATAPRSISR